jgi:hypothetical protein
MFTNQVPSAIDDELIKKGLILIKWLNPKIKLDYSKPMYIAYVYLSTHLHT